MTFIRVLDLQKKNESTKELTPLLAHQVTRNIVLPPWTE